MATLKGQRTLKALDEIKKERDYLEDSVLGGEVDPDDAEIMLRVLRIMNNRDGRRATFLYHFVMEFNEGSITITPPPPGKTDPPPPSEKGEEKEEEKIVVGSNDDIPSHARGDDTVAFNTEHGGAPAPTVETRQPLALSRGYAHRRDGVHVETYPRDDSNISEDTETRQQRLERLRDEIKRHRDARQSKTSAG